MTGKNSDQRKSPETESQAIPDKDAIEIFSLRSRATCGDNPEHQYAAGRSAVVCEMFNVDAKLVRDIWTRKAYGDVTQPFWTEREKLLNACDQYRTSGAKTQPEQQPNQAAAAGGVEHGQGASPYSAMAPNMLPDMGMHIMGMQAHGMPDPNMGQYAAGNMGQPYMNSNQMQPMGMPHHVSPPPGMGHSGGMSASQRNLLQPPPPSGLASSPEHSIPSSDGGYYGANGAADAQYGMFQPAASPHMFQPQDGQPAPLHPSLIPRPKPSRKSSRSGSQGGRRRHSMGSTSSTVPNGSAAVPTPHPAAGAGAAGGGPPSSPSQAPMPSYANANDPAALQQQDKFLGWRARWRQSGSFRSSIQSLDSYGTRGSESEGDDDDENASRASQSGSKRNLLELLGDDAQHYYSPMAGTPNKRLSIEGGSSPIQLSHFPHHEPEQPETFSLDMMGGMHVSSNSEADSHHDLYPHPHEQGTITDTFARMLSAVSEGEGDRAESFDALACKSDGRVLMRGSGGVELPLRLPSTGSNRAPMTAEEEDASEAALAAFGQDPLYLGLDGGLHISGGGSIPEERVGSGASAQNGEEPVGSQRWLMSLFPQY